MYPFFTEHHEWFPKNWIPMKGTKKYKHGTKCHKSNSRIYKRLFKDLNKK